MTGASVARENGFLAMRGLFRREMVRFMRQPSRIAASIGTPLLIWGFLASGFAELALPGVSDGGDYRRYLIPGSATLVALFASIFAAMSLIEDRRDGFLRSVLVSPAPRWALVAGKTGAGSLLAALQAAVVLCSIFLFADVPALGMFIAILMLFIVSCALTAMGLGLAWRIQSSEGFHGVMNGLLMPMWLLSGAIFPYESAAAWMRPVMLLDPLFWANESIRSALSGGWNWPASLGSIAFAAAMIAFASAALGRGTKGTI